MRMLHLLTILVAAGCGEKNEPEPLSKTKSPLSEKVQHANQDSKKHLSGNLKQGSLDNKLTLNGKTGVWEFETGGWIRSPPLDLMARFTSGSGTTAQGTTSSMVKTGVKIFETGDWVDSSPAIGSDGTVYIGASDKNLYAINGKTGAKLWEFKTGGFLSTPAISSDGTVYGSYDDKLPIPSMVRVYGNLKREVL